MTHPASEPKERVTLSRGAAAVSPDLLANVQQVFADVTRYPIEVLEPDADIEEDLGIDSVKLGEIVAALRERFTLPPPEVIQERFPAERMRTIAGVVAMVSEVVATEAPGASSARSTAALVEQPAAVRVARESGVAPRVESKGRPFEGKIALVTGSGRGLGKALACHLADLGATVVINSFHSRRQGEATAEEIAAGGGSAIHIWASVANDAQRHALYDEIEARLGALDFFINSASNGMLAPIAEITPEHWERAYRTNIVALQQGALRAARLMRPRGGGKMVTLSMTPSDRYLPHAGCMAAVKAGVESLTRYLAVEFAPQNIRVNCVKAGAVYGELVEKWPDGDKLTPEWEARTPLGRMAKPEDVAAVVGAVLRDEFTFMTGATVTVDGGHCLPL